LIHEIEINKPDLTPYQEEFLYNDARFTITEASTKIGKTFAHIWFIYEQAHKPHNKPNYNYWWVAPVYSQTKIAFNRMRAKIAPTGLYKVNESNLIITCPNGVHIHFKSAEKPDNLYGEDVYGIVFDEAPRAREDAFFALRSTLTATGGWMKLIGNFGGTANWVHKLKQKANTDKEYRYFKVTAWDGVKYGVLNESEVLQAQKDLPPKIFKQLYLAEEQESKDQLISFTAMKNLFTNSFVERTGQMYISADIALHGSDKFIVLVWDGWVLIDYIEVDKTDAKQVEELLRDTATKYKVPHSNIVYDSDGLGAFLRGYLSTAIPFNNGGKPVNNANYSNIKNQCGYELAKKINRNEVYINCDIDQTELFKELECLQSYALDRDGKLQLMPKKEIKEIIGHSPDKLDAFIMRMYFEILPKAVYYV
jgi:hypothetical protein